MKKLIIIILLAIGLFACTKEEVKLVPVYLITSEYCITYIPKGVFEDRHYFESSVTRTLDNFVESEYTTQYFNNDGKTMSFTRTVTRTYKIIRYEVE